MRTTRKFFVLLLQLPTHCVLMTDMKGGPLDPTKAQYCFAHARLGISARSSFLAVSLCAFSKLLMLKPGFFGINA